MIEIRNASTDDVNEIVRIHCNAFQGFFLTSLGPAFLKFYYSCFIKSNETVCMVAHETSADSSQDQNIVGFSAATMVCKGFNIRLIKQNLISFGILSLKLLFSNPGALLRLVKNLTKKSETAEDNEDYAELYSIGVDSHQQGKGIGKKLLAKTEEVLKAEGADRVSLTTDYDNNESAVGFYNSMGYEILYEFVTYPNRKMYRLIKSL